MTMLGKPLAEGVIIVKIKRQIMITSNNHLENKRTLVIYVHFPEKLSYSLAG